MEMMTSGWTDERMDDLKQEIEKQGRRMEDGFRDLRAEIGSLRQGMGTEIGGLRSEMGTEIGTLRQEMGSEIGSLCQEMGTEIGGLRKEMDARFDRLGERIEARFDTMLYALIAFGGAMFAGMASLVAALIVTQL